MTVKVTSRIAYHKRLLDAAKTLDAKRASVKRLISYHESELARWTTTQQLRREVREERRAS